MTPEIIREVALTVAAVGAAGAVLIGAVRWLAVRVERDRALSTVAGLVPALVAHLDINGDDDTAHPDDRGKPLRSLVLRVSGDVREIKEEQAAGRLRFRRHEGTHQNHSERLAALEGEQ